MPDRLAAMLRVFALLALLGLAVLMGETVVRQIKSSIH